MLKASPQKNGKNISVYFSEEYLDLLERLERIGTARERSRSWLIVEALERYVRQEERQLPFR